MNRATLFATLADGTELPLGTVEDRRVVIEWERTAMNASLAERFAAMTPEQQAQYSKPVNPKFYRVITVSADAK